MKPHVILEKSCMAFELKSGEMLYISNEDVQSIANSFLVEMMVHKNTNVYVNKRTSVKTCQLLYNIVTEQGNKMSKSLRENYLKAILELSENDEQEYISVKKLIEDGEKIL